MSLPAHLLPIALVLAALASAPLRAMDVDAYAAEARVVLESYLASDDPEIAARAAEVIGESCGSTWGTTAILEIGALDSSHDRVVYRSLLALGMLQDASSIAPVAAKAKGDAYIASAAAESLAMLISAHPESGTDILSTAEELAGHESKLVRILACSILTHIPDHAGAPKLVSLLRDDDSTDVRRAAAAALTMHAEDASVSEALVSLTGGSALTDAEPGAAEMTVLALGYVRGERRGAALANAMGALKHDVPEVSEAAIAAVSLLVTSENCVDHQDPLNQHIGTIASAGKQPQLLVLLEALELRMALLAPPPDNFNNIDKDKYPVYFFDAAAERAVMDMERKLVYQTSGRGDMTPQQDAAARGASDALLALDRRALRALMSAQHFKGNNKARGAPIDDARVVEAARGNDDANSVLDRLESRAADLDARASQSRGDLEDTQEKHLDSLYVRWSEVDHPWQWVMRIEAAGDFLRIFNGR